jgi:catecholate siderophore receptor
VQDLNAPLLRDAALYFNATQRVSLQANFENILDQKYFVNADRNDNITPGRPSAIRLALNWRL